MADNVVVSAGTGTTVAADEVIDGTLGTVKVQYVKIMDATIDGTTKAAVGANGLASDVKASVLPTGAATAAKQPALGTAGTASADVITVQGKASMTPLVVDGSAVTQPVQDVADAATNAAVPAKAIQIGFSDGTNLQAPLTAQGDSKSAWLVAETVTGLYNGSTIDRAKSVATGIQGVGINDGTNTANVVAGDSGFNGVATASATKSITFTSVSTGAQTIGPWNVEGYAFAVVHITANTSGGLAWTSQFSQTSGGTYASVSNVTRLDSAGNTPGALGTTNGAYYGVPLIDNYWQLSVSALTSGAISGTITYYDKLPLTMNNFVSQSGTWTVGSNSATGSAVPANAFYMGLNNSTNLVGWASLNGVGDGTSGTAIATSGGWNYNGATWDRVRGNLDNITISASAAQTTTQTSADQTNYNGRGVIVTLDMTVVGTGSVTLEIDMKDPVSGKYVALLTGAAVVGNSTNVYTVYPGAPSTANVSVNSPLPRTWRVKVTANNANSATYSVGASVIL